MMDDVKEMLAALGYTFIPSDEWILGVIIKKTEDQIKSECGVYDAAVPGLIIPEALHETAAQMSAAEFLMFKKSTGQLTGFDFDAAVKQISEGDTSVTFSETTPEKRMDDLISYLIDKGNNKLASYRCVKW
ncbi:MAG: hypothetical protein Q8865_04045 [Bacillota bacterium]|nr:hypothetical protein [Bacillota bacterium]